jgi:hypothetical protein
MVANVAIKREVMLTNPHLALPLQQSYLLSISFKLLGKLLTTGSGLSQILPTPGQHWDYGIITLHVPIITLTAIDKKVLLP